MNRGGTVFALLMGFSANHSMSANWLPSVTQRLSLDRSLHEVLQFLSVTVFDKVPLIEALAKVEPKGSGYAPCNLQKSFDF
jgi:hypothetical protein